MIEHSSAGYVARCDECGAHAGEPQEYLSVAMFAAATEGWSLGEQHYLCPRCQAELATWTHQRGEGSR